MNRAIAFASSILLCSCGMNRAYVEAMYADMPNEKLLREKSACNELVAKMTLGVPKHVRTRSGVIDAELQKRGITGPGLPPIAPPLKEGQFEDFGLKQVGGF